MVYHDHGRPIDFCLDPSTTDSAILLHITKDSMMQNTAKTTLCLLCTLLLSLQAASFVTPFHSQATTSRLHLEESTRTTTRRSTSRPRRPPPSRSRERATQTVERRRAPHQFDHTKAEARPFVEDPVAIIQSQIDNEDTPTYEFDDQLYNNEQSALIPEGSHLIYKSLDDLFPNCDMSNKFCSDGAFRNAIRNAMREDIFDSTEAYSGMSEKARKMLLLPDSSLQGSWRCDQQNDLRMKKLTTVLKSLGESAPTGDEFMNKIGSLCGSSPSTHWIDIVGVMDRRIPHSWHQDTGRSIGGDTYTVLLGFPKEDNYNGVGVYSHAVKLKYERVAGEDHPRNEPVVYPGLEVDERYIVRPRFAKGREILMFRDVDVIHSSPDVAFRSSVMRFM